MNKGLWIARKNYLFTLLRQVSNFYGGDDPDWLKEHWRQLIESHPGEMIEEPIQRYLSILEQCK
jgi:hypothetical protein